MKMLICIAALCVFYSTHKTDEKPIKFVHVKTECVDCRKAFADSMYNHKVHIAKNTLGYVRVRRDAACFEVANCKENLIDSIPDNTWIYAMGPVKNAEGPAGIAYIIKIKDKKGNFYNGYLSFTVLDSIDQFKNQWK